MKWRVSMSYPIIACEDNFIQLHQLKNVIRNYVLFHDDFFKLELFTRSPQDVLDYLKKFKPQNGIYFLDIDLKNKMTGIDLAERIRKIDSLGKIVFVTTHEELAPMTLRRKVEALGFILKDQSPENFRDEIMEILELARERIIDSRSKINRNFSFSIGKQAYNVHMDEVLYIETSVIPHRLVLQTINGQFEFYGKLNTLETKYPNLFRVSRSCLVNLEKVQKVDFAKRYLRFSEKRQVAFSIRQSKKMKEYFNNLT